MAQTPEKPASSERGQRRELAAALRKVPSKNGAGRPAPAGWTEDAAGQDQQPAGGQDAASGRGEAGSPGAGTRLRDVPMFADPAAWTPAAPAPPGAFLASEQALAGYRSSPRMDWELVRRLKSISADRIEDVEQAYIEKHGRVPGPEDRRELGKPLIQQVVTSQAQLSAAAGELWSPATEDAIFKAVFDSIYGYGRMQPLFDLKGVRSVTVHGTAPVRVRYTDGRYGRLPRWPTATRS